MPDDSRRHPCRSAPVWPAFAKAPTVYQIGATNENAGARIRDGANALTLVLALGAKTKPLGRDSTGMPSPAAPWAPWFDPDDAGAAMEMLRTTAIRTLRQHVPAGRRCALCGVPWPCDPAHLAASALGSG
jgi:hypothetical protein